MGALWGREMASRWPNPRKGKESGDMSEGRSDVFVSASHELLRQYREYDG